jgi:hypothetical protein
MRPYVKKTHHENRAGGVAQDEGAGFKPQYCKKRRWKRKRRRGRRRKMKDGWKAVRKRGRER